VTGGALIAVAADIRSPRGRRRELPTMTASFLDLWAGITLAMLLGLFSLYGRQTTIALIVLFQLMSGCIAILVATHDGFYPLITGFLWKTAMDTIRTTT
jgi:hypothetical protein